MSGCEFGGVRMTHEQFVWWLQGFLDSGTDIDLEGRTRITEKLNEIGSAPAPKQPASDKPKSTYDLLADESGRYVRGIGVSTMGLATAGLATSEPMLMMTNSTVCNTALSK